MFWNDSSNAYNWLSHGWVINASQLLYNEPSLIVASCFSTPLCCSCLIISMKKSCKCSSYCHSLAHLALTDSLSLNTCCSNYWLRVVIIAITLIDTLSVIGNLGDVMALELIGLVLNMFCTSIFWGHSSYLCYMLEEIIQG